MSPPTGRVFAIRAPPENILRIAYPVGFGAYETAVLMGQMRERAEAPEKVARGFTRPASSNTGTSEAFGSFFRRTGSPSPPGEFRCNLFEWCSKRNLPGSGLS